MAQYEKCKHGFWVDNLPDVIYRNIPSTGQHNPKLPYERRLKRINSVDLLKKIDDAYNRVVLKK